MTKAKETADDGVEDEIDAIRQDIAKRGARAAYNALLEVCGNKDAPAQARSASGIAILRAAGLNEPAPQRLDKPVEELSLAELREREALARQELVRAEADLQRLRALEQGRDDPFA